MVEGSFFLCKLFDADKNLVWGRDGMVTETWQRVRDHPEDAHAMKKPAAQEKK